MEQQIRIFFSIIKDTHLTGKIKKNKGVMFMPLTKTYVKKNRTSFQIIILRILREKVKFDITRQNMCCKLNFLQSS